MDNLYEAIEQVARDLFWAALKDIPADVRKGLAQGLTAEKSGGNTTAEHVLFTILKNIDVADQQNTLVCQDTGLPIYKVSVGTKVAVNIPQIKERITRACERATLEYPLRSNSVHPLTRKHTGTNTGRGIPIIKLEFVPDSDVIRMVMAPKGSGSENMSFLGMLNPSDGRKGVMSFVLHCIFESGARPCPPMIVGIGLGGTSDLAMQMAKEASTFREVGSASNDADIAELERELLHKINQTGIGPQGLGGATTALAVNIEWAHTHISQNPVAVNIQCWRGERAEAVISGDGQVRFVNGTS